MSNCSQPPWSAAHQASLSFTISRSLLNFMSIKSVMLSSYLILFCPLILSSIFPSISLFQCVGSLLRWPKYWSFSFRISPSNKYSGLISFRIDWFDLLTVQGTLKSLLQHHNSRHQFFGTHLPYGQTLTSVHDYWINHSFDNMVLCQQMDVSAF